MRELRCQDVGQQDCKFVAQGKDDNEVMQKAAQHAKSAHNMAPIPPDVEKKARSVIRETRCRWCSGPSGPPRGPTWATRRSAVGGPNRRRIFGRFAWRSPRLNVVPTQNRRVRSV